MGRVEKQIIAGALALVAVFLTVVVFKGIKDPVRADEEAPSYGSFTEYADPETPPLERAPVAPPESAETAKTEYALDIRRPTGSAAAPGGSRSGPAAAQPPKPPPVPRDGSWNPEYDEQLIPYLVKAGDTIGHIAQRELGSVRYVEDIQLVNEELDPRNLKVGTYIYLPVPRDAATGGAKAPAGSGTPGGQPALQPAAGGRKHAVAVGDNLWKISTRYYGDGSGVGRIVEANRPLLQSEDDVLSIGMVLVIPDKP